jgi:hypothetical protein
LPSIVYNLTAARIPGVMRELAAAGLVSLAERAIPRSAARRPRLAAAGEATLS